MTAPAASGNGGTCADAGSSVLAGRWRIEPEQPLPAFDRPSAQAFAACEPQTPDRPLVGFVCTSGLPFRAGPARLLAGASVPGLLRLIAFGMARWPPEQARVPVLIYERPTGDAVSGTFHRRSPDVAGDEAIRRLIRPIVQGLRELQRNDIAHRGIRPDNLWFRDPADDAAVLGCGLTGPAGWDQPSVFEPIDRAMAERAGRGEGDIADDIYALGATVLWLVAGVPPRSAAPDAEVLAARVEKGSYSILTQGVRLPGSLVEPLRGMLADDPAMRWSIRDVQTWLEGTRPPIRVSPPRVTAEAPFVFDGKPYRGLRSLAMAMAGDVPMAARVIRSGALQNWLRHVLHESARAKDIDSFVGGTRPRADPASHSDDALVARTLLLLDERAPVRYKDVAFCVDGFGPSLANRVVDGGSVQALAEAVLLGLPKLWLSQSGDASEIVTERGRRVAACARSVSDPRPGFGIERCLYSENPGLPCLSPPLRGSGVLDLSDLLPELETVAVTLPNDKLIDRHVAAFIVARMGEEAEEPVSGIGDSDEAVSVSAVLATLARIQARYPDAPRPRLAKWVGRKLPAAVAAVRHRPTRAVLELHAARLIAQGDLCALHALICDPERRCREDSAFRAALVSWRRAEIERSTLEAQLPARQLAAQIRGGRFAAMIGLSVALISVGFTILLNLR